MTTVIGGILDNLAPFLGCLAEFLRYTLRLVLA